MSLIVSDLPWPAQQQGAPIAADYLSGLRLVIDGGAQYPQALSFSQADADGFRVLGTARVGGSGRGWSGAASTYVSARTTASNPAPLFEIPANSDWTVQFVIDGIGGVSGTNFGFFRSGSTWVGTTFIVQSGNDRRPWMRVNNTDVLRPASGPQWVTGQRLNLVARFRNASRADFWWDGRLQHSATHSASQDPLLGTSGIYALLMQNGNEITGGNLAAFRFWTRYLDDAQTQALAQSEHALYEPLRIWVPVSAGGGTIGNAPGATFTQTLAFAGGAAEGLQVGNAPGAAFAQTLVFAGGAATGAEIGEAPGASFTQTLAFSGGVATGLQIANAPGASFTQTLVFFGGAADTSGTANAKGGVFSNTLAFAGGNASGLIIANAKGGAGTATIAFVGGNASVPGTGGTYTLPPVAIYVGHNIAIGVDGRPIYIQF